MPSKIVIEGGHQLRGTVRISGAKNAALPLMAAALLARGKTVLRNVPNLTDVRLMCEILDVLGATTTFDNGVVEIDVCDETRSEAPYELVSEMRASFCVLGPLLGRRKTGKVSLPGGCTIGVRPVDLHLKGFKALGAGIEVDRGYVIASGEQMRGARVFLGGSMGSSVTGTSNVLCAAVLTPGVTIIEEAACEPEVNNLVEMLIAMGARIRGGGTPRLIVTGVEALQPVDFTVCPDRIEAGTFIAGAAVTRGDVTLTHLDVDAMGSVLDRFALAGVDITVVDASTLRVRGPERLQPTDITTRPYPGFPTDMHPQIMVAQSLADGISVLTEKIYPDRFLHVSEYNRMGANIRKEGNTAIIQGVEKLSGCQVKATDLRAGAGLVLLGLAATGTTEVFNTGYIDRGYDEIERKFRQLGAVIERQEYAHRRRRTDFHSGRNKAA